MILGKNRVPYGGPPQASPNFRPTMPHTRFLTHNDPFSNVHRRMSAYGPFHPSTMPMPIGPAPSVPSAPPTPVTPGAAASPIGPAGPGLSGFGFGSTGGTKMHMHVSPYATMRDGMIPGIRSNASNIRAGVRSAHGLIHRQMPFQTRALPPPPPPPPVVAPTSIKGLMGALFGGAGTGHRRARRHRWWHLNPPSTSEQMVADQTGGCETYPPRSDGIKVTVCNGRVVKYEDAQGNVNTPDQNSGVEYGSGGMAGLGFPGFRRFRQAAFAPAQMALQPFEHHRRHHRRHPWQQQQPYDAPPNPGSAPQFGRW